ncbi:MAG TPA: VTT domain-containing protein [Dehalococcoidia bacterium]|nr:VTT domain-containing protein [Dehalococcoidia bacterium]
MAEHRAEHWTTGSQRVSAADRKRDRGEQVWAERQADRFGRWLHDHTVLRWVVIAGLLVVTLIPGLLLLWGSVSTSGGSGDYAYFGVFFVNLMDTIPLIPIPGLSALGQGVIVTEAAHHVKWLIGVSGGLGMGLGEIPVYYTGTAARYAAEGSELRGPDWFRKPALWFGRFVQRLMRRHAVPTVFILSAIPNPALELAGISAGASGVGFWRFLVPVVAGKIVRGLILVYLARYVPFV